MCSPLVGGAAGRRRADWLRSCRGGEAGLERLSRQLSCPLRPSRRAPARPSWCGRERRSGGRGHVLSSRAPSRGQIKTNTGVRGRELRPPVARWQAGRADGWFDGFLLCLRCVCACLSVGGSLSFCPPVLGCICVCVCMCVCRRVRARCILPACEGGLVWSTGPNGGGDSLVFSPLRLWSYRETCPGFTVSPRRLLRCGRLLGRPRGAQVHLGNKPFAYSILRARGGGGRVALAAAPAVAVPLAAHRCHRRRRSHLPCCHPAWQLFMCVANAPGLSRCSSYHSR